MADNELMGYAIQLVCGDSGADRGGGGLDGAGSDGPGVTDELDLLCRI